MTPAPWTLKQHATNHQTLTGATAGLIADIHKDEDASLISAAPELFAALEQAYCSLKLAAVRLELDESTEFYKDIDAAYRALQKAKGETA